MSKNQKPKPSLATSKRLQYKTNYSLRSKQNHTNNQERNNNNHVIKHKPETDYVSSKAHLPFLVPTVQQPILFSNSTNLNNMDKSNETPHTQSPSKSNFYELLPKPVKNTNPAQPNITQH